MQAASGKFVKVNEPWMNSVVIITKVEGTGGH
jgi:hypothetical protein